MWRAQYIADRFPSLQTRLGAAIAVCASTALAVRPIEVSGTDFINPATGNVVQLLGIAYQPGGQSGYTPGVVDPLSDPAVCLRDAALMQRLGELEWRGAYLVLERGIGIVC